MKQRHPMVSIVSLAIGIVVVAAFLLRSTVSVSEKPDTVAEPTPTAVFPTLRHAGSVSQTATRTIGEQLDDVVGEEDHVARLTEFKTMLADWAARDPEAALAYVRNMKAGPEHTEGMLIVLQAIGRADTERAILLANDMVKDKEQAAIYNSLFATAVDGDVAKAIRAFNFVPAGEGRDNSLRALASKWATTDDAAALDWANDLTDERERDIARESVIDSVITVDPSRAITLAQQNLTGDARESVYSTAIHLLCERDPEAARDAFNQLSSDNQQPFTATEVARALAGKDMNAAIAWTDTLPAGSSRDAAVSFITRVTAQAAQ